MSEYLTALQQQTIPKYRNQLPDSGYTGQLKLIGADLLNTALNHAQKFYVTIDDAQKNGYFDQQPENHHRLRRKFSMIVHKKKNLDPSMEPTNDDEEWRNQIIQAVQESKEEISKAYDGIGDRVMEFIAKLPPSFRKEATDYWIKINLKIGEKVKAVIKKITEIIDAIVNWIKGVWSHIKDAWKRIEKLFVDAWESFIKL